MLSSLPRSRLLVTVLAVAAVGLPVGYRATVGRVASARPDHTVVAAGERAIRAVAPDYDYLTVSVEGRLRGGSLWTWEAAGTDEEGRDVAVVCWDARTGQLVSASYIQPRGLRARGGRLSSDEARLAAWTWLGDTGMASRSSWEAVGVGRRLKGAWIVEWRDGSRRMRVAVESTTGRLKHAFVYTGLRRRVGDGTVERGSPGRPA